MKNPIYHNNYSQIFYSYSFAILTFFFNNAMLFHLLTELFNTLLN